MAEKIELLTIRAEAAFRRSREIEENIRSCTSHITLLVKNIEFAFRNSTAISHEQFWGSQDSIPSRAFLETAEQLLEEGLGMLGGQGDDSYLTRAENEIAKVWGNFEKIIDNLKAMQQTPIIRRQTVQAMLHHKAKVRRQHFPTKHFSREAAWDLLSEIELAEIMQMMEENFLDDPSNHLNVRYWFNVASRRTGTSLEYAATNLQSWYDSSATIEALFNLYIVYVLRALEENNKATRMEAEKLIRDCKTKLLVSSVYNPNFSFFWLGPGSALQRLVSFRKLKGLNDPEWYKDPDGNMLLSRERGKVLSISFPTKGELLHQGSQLRLHFTPGFIRRVGTDAGNATEQFLRGRDEEVEVEFFIGFGYGGLRAFNVSRVEK